MFDKYLKPIKTADTNVVFAENQSEYLPLPAHIIKNDDYGRVFVAYKLTFLQRLVLLFNGMVHIQLMTFCKPLQPISVSILSQLDDCYLPKDELLVMFNGINYRCKLTKGMPVVVSGVNMVVHKFLGRSTILCKNGKGSTFKVDKTQIRITEEVALMNTIETNVCQ